MLSELREDAWGKDAHVILLTNLNDTQKIEQGVKYGVTDYLVKTDWHIQDLIGKINAIKKKTHDS